MRAITILTFLCLFAAYSCQSYDLVVGEPTYGDVALYTTTECKYGFPFIVRTSIIEYPEQGMEDYAVIKAINVRDNFINGNGGYASITDGGIGKHFVRIKLKSQRGKGFNFTVTIYGRYLSMAI